jgi:hypothetical protein
MSVKFFEAACLTMAWVFAVSMISAFPFLVVSTISECLGRTFRTSIWLGIAASGIVVSAVVVLPLLSRARQV